MPKPVVLQVKDFPEWDQTPLDVAFDMRKLYEAPDTAAFLAQHGPQVQAIATRGGVGADRALIEACPNLEMIAVYGVGYDAVDLDACRAQGVRVSNTPDVLTKDVADLGVAMMLCLSRQMIAAEAWVRSGNWQAKGGFPLSQRIFGRKAGILGLGRIGFEVGRRLVGFDMDIAYCDVAAKPFAGDWSFVPDPVQLARQSDVLFVTLAASAETRHIVGPQVIAALGAEGMVVNISRASNIDEDALLDALENRTLGGAALDVFDGEPAINPRFLSLDNVLLQPHHASGTVDTRKDMGRLMRDNLTAHFAGKALLTPVL